MSFGVNDSYDFLERIATAIKNSPDLIRENLRGAMDVIEMTYGVAPHRQFVLEYIQNAIDARAKKCTFEIHGDKILITNDGREFDSDDVKSICSIAKSSKQPTANLVGFIGIGAKSAFLLGSRLEVHSGRFHFVFDRSIGEDKPWELIPQPIDRCMKETCYVVQKSCNTSFVLSKLNSDVTANLIRIFFESKDDYYIDARTLLFLPIDELKLEIMDIINKRQRTIRRSTLNKETVPNDNSVLNIEKIILEDSKEKQGPEKWLVLSKNIVVDSSVREDRLTKLYRREQVTERQISIAFLLDENEDLVSCEGVVKFGVFSYMPLKEMESGLNFLIHGDFITEPGRATIASEARWNIYLRNKFEEFILKDVYSYLMNNDKYKSQVLIMVPAKSVGGFFDELSTKIRNGLRESNCILTYNTCKKPFESLLIPGYVYELLMKGSPPGDSLPLFPTHFQIYREYHLVRSEVVKHIERLKISRDTLRNMGIYVLPLTHIVANTANRRSIEKLYDTIMQSLVNVEDYAEMFEYLIKRELEDIRNNQKFFFKNLILLTDSGKKRPLSTIFALTYDKVRQDAPNKVMLNLVEKFGMNLLVAQNLIPLLKSFVREIGYVYVDRGYKTFNLVEELKGSENSVYAFFDSLKIYARQEIVSLIENLESAVEAGNFDDVKKITEKLVEYFEVSGDLFNNDDLKRNIRFKMEGNNEFKVAIELLLPYSENHKLKDILDFIDKQISKGGPSLHKYLEIRKLLFFPDLSFYDNIEIEKLLSFIKFLGSDSYFSDMKRRIVEALGLQLVAIREWERNGREVREVDGRTHDLEVMGDEVYYIEVKSTHSTADEFELELRAGQIEALKDPHTRLYIVTEVLTNPKLIIPSNDAVNDALKYANIKVKVRELLDSTAVQENFDFLI